MENKAIDPTDELMASLYEVLRGIARREHYRAGSPQTLQATALIGEAYIKLQKRAGWESQSHFLGCASTAIRHILIDAARARMTAKRGSGELDFTRSLDSLAAAISEDGDVVRLGDALKLLGEMDPNLAQVVDCRFFAEEGHRGVDPLLCRNLSHIGCRLDPKHWYPSCHKILKQVSVITGNLNDVGIAIQSESIDDHVHIRLCMSQPRV